MTLFSKIGSQAKRLFTKVTSDPNLFRKINNTARKIDNTVRQVGNYASMALPQYSPYIQAGVQGLHQLKNGIEKGTKYIENIRGGPGKSLIFG